MVWFKFCACFFGIGFADPLTVKFADSGNKKKFSSPPRPWVDRSSEVISE